MQSLRKIGIYFSLPQGMHGQQGGMTLLNNLKFFDDS
jgi:hypothetical protein